MRVCLVDGGPVSARITMTPWPEEALKVLRVATTAYLASLVGPSEAGARTDAQRELATVLDAMTRFAGGTARDLRGAAEQRGQAQAPSGSRPPAGRHWPMPTSIARGGCTQVRLHARMIEIESRRRTAPATHSAGERGGAIPALRASPCLVRRDG